MDATQDGSVHRTFDYQGSGIGSLGAYLILFGVLWLGVIGFMGYGATHASAQSKADSAPLPFFLLLLGLFALIGIALLALGIGYVMAVKNESVEVDGDQVTWTNRHGQVSLRCTLEQIQSVEETTLSQPTARQYGYAPMHHKCVVKTSSGTMIFSDEISDYDWLKSFLLKHETVEATGGTFRYRSPAIFLVAAFVIPITVGLIYGFTSAYMNGETMKVNGVDEVTPIWAPMAVTALSAVFWVVIGGIGLQYLNERIVVDGDHVRYFNIFGVKKVDVPLAWVEQGSYEENGTMLQSGGNKYSVGTPQGTVGWSDAITRCTDLCQLLAKAASGKVVGG